MFEEETEPIILECLHEEWSSIVSEEGDYLGGILIVWYFDIHLYLLITIHHQFTVYVSIKLFELDEPTFIIGFLIVLSLVSQYPIFWVI